MNLKKRGLSLSIVLTYAKGTKVQRPNNDDKVATSPCGASINPWTNLCSNKTLEISSIVFCSTTYVVVLQNSVLQ